MTKPFDTKELLARIAVRLREATHSPLATVYTCGDLTLDTSSHETRANGIPVQLTRAEYAILKLLMQNPGQVLAKSVLLDRISADTPDCTDRKDGRKDHCRLQKRYADDLRHFSKITGNNQVKQEN